MPLKRILVLLLILNFVSNAESKIIRNKVLQDSLLKEGVVYKYLEIGERRKKIRAHLIELDKNKLNYLNFKLVSDNLNELSSLIELNNGALFCINASFFRTDNQPVGLTIIDNKIAKLNSYKSWKSLVVHGTEVSIEKVDLESFIIHKNEILKIDSYNESRGKDNELILYNSFFGPTVPYINKKTIDSVYSLYLFNNFHDMLRSDSYEFPLSYSGFKSQIGDYFSKGYIADSTIKYVLKPLEKIKFQENKFICISIETNLTEINDNYIISTSDSINIDLGDTIKIYNKLTPPFEDLRFAFNTTPMILKNSNEKITSKEEGVNSRRFIKSHLARSALGYNDEKIFLVSIEPSRGNHIKGATLKELSWIMETIGCENAINLDGGSSVSFILNGVNLAIPYDSKYSRPVSTGLFIK